ncbi:hypothetical protein A9Q84_11635 [Halobacteriovorax marinus]|mgnify:CR=1 FL=1|uniref:Lipoprotein n=1 Tax=Halobacteriovorax marinus TaxID=97084 RepID=A0A1Y5FDN1_9BACT|nr:hypothetical protein A9Q84_11635 [Halobacteriovorax marinus]
MNAISLLKKRSLVFLSLLGLLTFTSCGGDSSNVKLEGIDGPHISLLEDNMMISMVIENMEIQGGLRYNIPKYPNSYIEISPDLQSNGTLMSISVSLDDLLDADLQGLDPQSLPGGRALPGVINGKIPAVAFSIENFHNMSVYLGPEIFGVFVPADLGIDGAIASFKYYISDTRAGTVSLVGNDADGENAGILLLLDIKGKWKKRMKKIAKKY